ncbi:MAG: alpha/beta fold hydrolase [Betaproteobacteria bacterium]
MVTAITLCCALIVGTAAYALWALAAWQQGANAWLLIAGAPLLYLALVAVITLLAFAMAWRYRSPRPPDVALGMTATARLFAQEFITLAGSAPRMGLGWWMMREPDPPVPMPTPILLVHGVLCNAGVWLGMRGALRRAGVGPVFTLSYGPPLSSIERFADQLKVRIDEVLAVTGAPKLALVGHSMGGLVARDYLRRHGARRVDRLITIATPHAGSMLAWVCPGTSLRQLRPGNRWLESLNAAAAPLVPTTSIWSWHDSMVAPQDSCILPGARNIAVAGVGHNAMLRDQAVTRIVAVELLRVLTDTLPLHAGTPSGQLPVDTLR